ncbi:hypothetical protein L21_0587 [Methanoculleus chikugoensis]|jgi:hypothetical protein|uniref:Uncharacterized protein n=1 Tax=Methanoculleus chikugoensis TaxID=118126 RepID=A0A1M4MIF8_9EURY|nr:hypothetical protein L21_0587 [Methanoculleus chikugoensis]
MKTAQGKIRTLAVVAALILLTVAAGCFDRPLTPGHRTLEGDVWVLKLDDAGDREWFTVIDSGKFDEAFSIVEIPNGYAIAGSVSETGDFHPVPRGILLDREGTVIWDTTYPTPDDRRGTGIAYIDARGFAAAASRGLVILTDTEGSERHRTDLAAEGEYWAIAPSSAGGWIVAGGDRVARIDANGTVAWQQPAGGVSPDSIPIIVPDPMGGFLVSGEAAEAPGAIIAVKFDDRGAPVWNTTVQGGPGERYLLSAVRQDATGGYSLLAGVTDGEPAGVLEVSLGEDGSILRRSTINASAPVTWTPDGGYLSAVLAENDYGGALLRVERFDEDGAASWTSTQRLDEYSRVVALIPTSDGGSAVLGMYMKY